MKTYTLNFYKKNERWYADIPEHTEEDNEMVMGADTFLDVYSEDGEHCHLQFAIEEPAQYIMKLERGEHDWDGAYYTVDNGMQLWICNVTHDVCGEHPEFIYIINIY